MTEAEWLVHDDPLRMLEFAVGRTSERRLRLFLHACCARALDAARVRDVNKRGRAHCLGMLDGALRTVERFADGLCGTSELERARREAEEAVDVPSHIDYGGESCLDYESAVLAGAAAQPLTPGGVVGTCRRTLAILSEDHGPLTELLCEFAERLRDVVGNPFRPVEADPAWLAWNDGAVPKIAESIYASRSYAELPYLADALEDAGCVDEAIHRHCRGEGPHVRGCWVLDLFIEATRRFAAVAAAPEPEEVSRPAVVAPPALPQPPLRPGDWLCPGCHAHNFAKRNACMKCKQARPTARLREGDWICPGCQAHNVARRQSCHQCTGARSS